VTEQSGRPFYTEYAWAFDAIIDRPVRKECAAIAAWLVERGVLPGASLLDAGCGTGRYATELARRGYVVHGVDASRELIDIATRSAGGSASAVSFEVGDILVSSTVRYDAILCRGVLNDFVSDADRQAVFERFAHALRPRGVLILDVREWHASAERKSREPLFRKRVSTDRGELTFTSVTEIDAERQQLVIDEQHVLTTGGRTSVSEHRFVMRCWTRDELHSTLERAGFDGVSCFGAYDPAIVAGATDRLVAIAQRAPAGL
jgi:SAM-dependent methyltransferase